MRGQSYQMKCSACGGLTSSTAPIRRLRCQCGSADVQLSTSQRRWAEGPSYPAADPEPDPPSDWNLSVLLIAAALVLFAWMAFVVWAAVDIALSSW